MLYLAADHRGFEIKEAIKRFLDERGVAFEDVGAPSLVDGDDYVDYASLAAEKIAASPLENKGIFLCGSGHGMEMVANKFRGVRAALCWNKGVARESREHEDANVLALPADWLSEETACEIVSVWLGTNFSKDERHVRRLEKIATLEDGRFCRCC